MKFPSDQITFGQMRARDRITETNMRADCIDAIAMFSFEVKIAELAFANAMGLPAPPFADRGLAVDIVRSGYREYGLARGKHEADRLIADIEAQAANQAESFRGRG